MDAGWRLLRGLALASTLGRDRDRTREVKPRMTGGGAFVCFCRFAASPSRAHARRLLRFRAVCGLSAAQARHGTRPLVACLT